MTEKEAKKELYSYLHSKARREKIGTNRRNKN